MALITGRNIACACRLGDRAARRRAVPTRSRPGRIDQQRVRQLDVRDRAGECIDGRRPHGRACYGLSEWSRRPHRGRIDAETGGGQAVIAVTACSSRWVMTWSTMP